MEINDAVEALSSLAQETRLTLFRLLVQVGPQGVSAGELAETLGVPPATLSFHLKELGRAGMLSSRQEGRYIYYSADFDAMAALMTFLTQNCCQGMPESALRTVQSALTRCCTPVHSRQTPQRRKT